MTRIRVARLLTVSVLFAVGACASDPLRGRGEPEPPRELTAAEARVAESSVVFGLELFRAVHDGEAAANVLISPLSASLALGMALNGAAGPTFDAMRDALGFAGMAESEINVAYAGLLEQLHARDRRVEIAVANAVWHERSFPVEAAYLARARDHFAAHIAPLDFLDPAAAATINDWVEQRTNGRIRELIDSIDPLDRLILTNAVYFKAPWTQPFEPLATRDDAFTRADGTISQVPMMAQDAGYRWFSADDAFGVELPYADSAFSMVLIAPAAGRSLDALVADLSPAQWHDWLGRLQHGRIMLRMPKFRFEYGTPLNAALAALGMGIAFEPFAADFTRIAPVDDLHISRVQQNTFIDVHELGTEAAAATAVVISVTSMPPELTFDRPFIAAIRERSTGTLLFIGRIGAP